MMLNCDYCGNHARVRALHSRQEHDEGFAPSWLCSTCRREIEEELGEKLIEVDG